MSDDRLAEIRAMALAPWCKECDAVADLLSEVARLRAEVDRLRRVISDAARYSTPHTPGVVGVDRRLCPSGSRLVTA